MWPRRPQNTWFLLLLTLPSWKKKTSTNNLAPSRRCPFLVVLQGSAVWQPSMQGPPPGLLSALLGGGLLSTVPHVLWFTAAVKSISGASPDLFPFLMFLLGWINTSSKNEGTSHVGTKEELSPTLERELSRNWHWAATTGAIVRSSWDGGVRSPSVGAMAPNPRALSQLSCSHLLPCGIH